MINGITDLYAGPQQEASGGTALDRDAFMQLLVAQMRNQDPTEPTSNEQFVAQLAQFSALEETQVVNENLVALAALQQGNALMSQLTDASALIGKNISYNDVAGDAQGGTVEAVRFENGAVVLQVDGATVPLSSILEVTGADSPTDLGSDDGSDDDSDSGSDGSEG